MIPRLAVRALILVAAACAAPAEAPAQAWFVEATETHLPPKESAARVGMDVEAADLDGDGDPDLVVPQEFEPNKLLFNQGGRFVDASDRLPPLAPAAPGDRTPPGYDSEDVSVADFDRDGRLDRVIVSEDDVRMGRRDVHEYYRGLPGGRFQRVLGLLPDTEANAVAHADINGDGAPDLLIVGAGQDRLLINDGRGGFRDETAARLPREAATGQDGEFVDVDGDRDLDLALGLEGGHALWINDGRGRYTDETARRLPDPGNVEARKVTPVDIDADGDLDLYFSHVAWQGRQGQDRLYLNDGRGVFSVGSVRAPEETLTTTDAKFADFDGDGDLDLAHANTTVLKIFANEDGRFVDVTAAALPTPIEARVFGLEVADFDADGRPDLYVAMRAQGALAGASYDRLLLNVRR